MRTSPIRVSARRSRGVGGRAGWPIRLPAHRATTAHLQAAYPFIAESGLGAAGSYIGRDLFGGSFCYDPFELYAAGKLTNPNMLIAGNVGSGKSSFVKTFLWRQHAFGRAAWIADPKGEYGDLAAACGTVPIRLGPGLATRLNPFDQPALPTGPGHGGDSGAAGSDGFGRQLRLLRALASTALERPLTPIEHAACDLALTAVGGQDRAAGRVPVLPDLVDALLDPTEPAARRLRMSAGQLAEASRDLALVMRRMCEGDLAGMFDGPTSLDIEPGAPLVVLDLSAIYQHNRDALPLVMACATAWLQAAITAAGADRRYVVIDEAWALLSQLGTARWLQASYKLSRAHGVANIAVLHRFSDLSAAGDRGSQTVSLARGLLADAGTRVVYAQPSDQVETARTLLGLTSTEAGLLPHLAQGTALWKIGTRSFVVEHRRSPAETTMSDTDAAMTGNLNGHD